MAYLNSRDELTNENLIIGIGLILLILIFQELEGHQVDMWEARSLAWKAIMKMQNEHSVEEGDIEILDCKLFDIVSYDQEKSLLGNKSVAMKYPDHWEVIVKIDKGRSFYYLIELDVNGRYRGKNKIIEGKLHDLLKKPNFTVIQAKIGKDKIRDEREEE